MTTAAPASDANAHPIRLSAFAQPSADSLPDGWAWTTLGEVCHDPQYGWTTSATSEGRPHLLRTTDITSGHIDWGTVPYCREAPENEEKYILHDGDIVISRAGSVGFSLLIKNPQRAVFASYLIRFKPKINERYVAYFLQSPAYWQAISEKSLGIAIPNVNASKLKQIDIPLAPLPEQQRIVAEIEKQFTRLDAGVAALRRVQAALKRYKAAVLKAACEGRLVAQDPNDEPAAELLRRILVERGERGRTGSGRRGGGQGRQGQGQALPLQDAINVGATLAVAPGPELPRGWCWVQLGLLAKAEPNSIKRGPFGSTIKKEFFVPKGYKVYEQKHVIQNDFSLGHYYISKQKFEELREFAVEAGDLLISCSGTIGRIAVVPIRAEAGIINQALLKIGIDDQLIDKAFFTFAFQSKLNEVLVENTSGSAMKNMSSVKILKQKPYPLPPLAEQHRIVTEVERRLSVVQEVEAVVAANLARAERLRQAILKRAFAGRLVAQDAADEPASVLLERIRAAREEVAAVGNRRLRREPVF